MNATTVKVKAEKVRKLFKRWLKFEETFGNEAGKELCKERARVYVEEAQN